MFFAVVKRALTAQVVNSFFAIMDLSHDRQPGAMADGAPDKVDVTWKRVEIDVREEPMEWSIGGSLQFHGHRVAVKK